MRAPARNLGAVFLVAAAGLSSCTSLFGPVEIAAATPAGEACVAANACASGHCVDGVCCDTACTATCQACTRALTGGADGVCGSMSAGLPAPAGQCPAHPPCGDTGMCAGGGVCEQPAQGVACGSTCANASLTNSQCDGKGTCLGEASTPCPSSLQCDSAGSACLTGCVHDGDCTSGHFCSGGACAVGDGLGGPCTSNDECGSKLCVDSVCCNTACDTAPCTTCARPGSVGICGQAVVGASCNASGGKLCSASGSCVECNAATDCSGKTTPGCCGSACVDLATDGNNCGACGHGCLGGACTGGACQPILVATLPPSGYFATAEGGQGIAVDTTSVYWSYILGGGVNAGAIAKAPLSGGTTTTLYAFSASGYAGDVALGGGKVYFTNEIDPGPVSSCGVTGCGMVPTVLSPSENFPASIAVDADYVYWGATNALRYVPVTGGAPVQLAAKGITPCALVIDANNAYWVDFDYNTYSTPLPGRLNSGVVTPLASNGGCFLAADASFLYLGGVVLQRLAKNGGSPTTLSALSNPAQGIAVDATSVYWTGGSSVQSCPLPDCAGGAVTRAFDRKAPTTITADSVALYWVESGQVMKLAK